MDHSYDDIINLPHHVSKHHPQFAPFAALTGHSSAINEASETIEE